MKKLFSLLVLAIFALAGCDSSATSDYSVYLVTDAGVIDDKSFNESAWLGVQAFGEATGSSVQYIEPSSDNELENGLLTAIEAGADVVVAVGFMFEGVIDPIAVNNPDVDFILIDAVSSEANVASILFDEAQAGYLAGAMSGILTETDKLGFIGGFPIPPVLNFAAGFIQGVKSTNPDATVQVVYANDFTDVNAGTQIANTLIGEGVDIIHSAAGGVGIGAMLAMTEARAEGQDVWHIGVDLDQYLDAPEVNIISAVKGITPVTETVLNSLLNEETTYAGKTTVFNFDNEGADAAFDNPLFNEHAKKDEMTEAYDEAVTNINSVDNYEAFDVSENGIY